jgi:hypothetical protein
MALRRDPSYHDSQTASPYGGGNGSDVNHTRGEEMDSDSQDSIVDLRHAVTARFEDLPWGTFGRLGREYGAGLLALGWSALLAGFALALGAAGDWVRAGSAQLFVSEFVGSALVWLGGLLLVLSLRGLSLLRWSTVRGLIAAGLATILVSDVPWLVGARATASHPHLSSIHRTCLEAAHVALGINCLMVVMLALGGLLLLFRQPESRATVIRPLLVGSASLGIGYLWIAHSWLTIWGSGGRVADAGPVVALTAATYAVGQWWGQRDGLFSAHEVIQLREIRKRYRAGGLVP